MTAARSEPTTEHVVPAATRTLRLVAAAAPQAAPEAAPTPPAWIRNGTHHLVDELKLYFRTMWDFTRRPRATAAAWVAGEYKAIHPLNYFVKSVAVVAPWRAYWWLKFGVANNQAAGAAFGAYFFLILLTLAQPYLRLCGAKRSVTLNWAAGFYILGGVPMFASLLIEPLSLWSRHAIKGYPSHTYVVPGFSVHYAAGAGPTQFIAIAAVALLFGAYWFYLSSAIAGMQGISRWRAFIAIFGTTATLVSLVIVTSPFLLAIGLLHKS